MDCTYQLSERPRHIPPRYVCVVPAFNPGNAVTQVVSEVSTYVDLVIVVDDGSDEKNKSYLTNCARIHNVRLITFPCNKGKGYALIAGLKEAITHEPDYIFTIDSDGQHDPKEISRFKQFIATSHQSYDLVIGKREIIGETPLRSKVGNMVTARLFSALFERTIGDTQSGFRMLSADFAKEVVSRVRSGRYETEMRMLTYAVASGRVVGNVKIETIYLDKNKGSKFRPLRDSLRVLMPLTKYAGVAFASFLVDYAVFLLLSYVFGIYYLISHVIARICSGTCNFLSNKHLVFKSKGKKLGEGLRYSGAVLFSLSTTAALLYCFVDLLHISRALAKPIAEFTMFLVNFTVLNKFVFSD